MYAIKSLILMYQKVTHSLTKLFLKNGIIAKYCALPRW
uniref:Uncharacterized protein n=1 Tax=Rhizophora mucronata TaxID=61149 RepID=A0A2P2JF43_RHIMU